MPHLLSDQNPSVPFFFQGQDLNTGVFYNCAFKHNNINESHFNVIASAYFFSCDEERLWYVDRNNERTFKHQSYFIPVLFCCILRLLHFLFIHGFFFSFWPLAFFVCGGERVASIKITVHAGERGHRKDFGVLQINIIFSPICISTGRSVL